MDSWQPPQKLPFSKKKLPKKVVLSYVSTTAQPTTVEQHADYSRYILDYVIIMYVWPPLYRTHDLLP
jgi:hypothetical protein